MWFHFLYLFVFPEPFESNDSSSISNLAGGSKMTQYYKPRMKKLTEIS